MRKIVILLIALMFIQTSSAYETGYLNISSYVNFYQYELPIGAGGALQVDLNKAYVNYPTYTTMDDFRFKNDQCSFPYPSNSTTFIITSGATTSSGGTVSGVVSYDTTPAGATHNEVRWSFMNTAFLTSDLITFSYTDPGIFTGFSCAGATLSRPKSILTSVQPAALGVVGGADIISDAYNGIKSKYSFTGAARSSNTWNISYFGANAFTIQVHKDDKASKMYLYNESSISYYKDTGYNTDDFGWFGNNTGQIILNGTLSTGGYNSIIINNSGPNVTSPPPHAGTNPVNITKPSTGANIVFDKTEYFVGDNANVSWYYSDTEWTNFLTSKRIDFKINGNYRFNSITGEHLDSITVSSQTGYYIFQTDTVGSLETIVQTCTLFIICNNLGSDVADVNPPGNSWIALSNSTQNIFGYTNVTYHIGYSTASYVPGTIVIEVRDKANGNLADVAVPSLFPDGNVTVCGSSLSTRVCQEGVYSVELKDALKGVLDKKTLTVIRIPDAINTLGITVSNVTTDKSFYFIYDFMTVNYQIDDANFTNYSIRGEVFNNNKSTITKRWYQIFTNQTGQFDTNINNNPNQKCEQQKNCWIDIGLNTFRLVTYNSTNNSIRVIAQTNFTVSSTTTDGYGLIVSTTTPKKGEQFTVKTIVPTGHTATLKIADAGYANNYSLVNQIVQEGTNTFPVTITRVNSLGVGYYDVLLYGDDAQLKVKIPITVTTAEIAKTESEQNAINMLDNIVGFLGLGVNDISKFIFAMFWIIVFGFAGFIITKNNAFGGVITAFFPFAVFAYIAYIPHWVIVFFAIILAIKINPFR